TMLWILGPTCLLPERAAFAAWSLAGFLAICAVVLRARLSWTAMLPLATPLAIYALALGQTAILSTAGLLWLMTHDRPRTDRATWSEAAVLWLLTAKPPVALTGGLALLLRGGWRPVLVAGGLTVASTIALHPWLGGGWVHDYTALVGNYDRVRLPSAFAWSVVPQSMSNLRAALSVDLGMRDDVAVKLCNALWATALAALVVMARWRSFGWGHVW